MTQKTTETPMHLMVLACLLLAATLVAADLSDNQIEDLPARLRAAPLSRGRVRVKWCAPCRQTECQVMGMQRFSEPRCEALGGVGAPCRPFQEAENKTLHFPHMLMHCSDVFMQFCPCAAGLECDLELAQCRRPAYQSEPSVATTDSGESSLDDDEDFDVRVPDDRLPVAFEPVPSERLQQERSAGSRFFPWAVARFH